MIAEPPDSFENRMHDLTTMKYKKFKIVDAVP